MRIVYFFLSLLITLVFVSCKTTPPTDPVQPPVETGAVFVSSNIEGGLIIADGVSTGSYSPDTIELKTGNHTITIQKAGYTTSPQTITVIKDSVINLSFTLSVSSASKVVLMEDFGNVSCVPCVTSNLIVRSIRNYTFNAGQLVIVKFPTNFPGPNDVLYLHAKPYSDSRISYYNVFTAPTIIIDGITKPISTDSNAIKNAITNRLNQFNSVNPKFEITASDSVSGSIYSVYVDLKCTDTTGINFANLVIHIAVVESIVEFSTPPGSNGETKFYDVMRRMLPGSSGTPVAPLFPGSSRQYSESVAIDAAWNIEKIESVIFIQDKVTKEVFQTALAK